MTTSDRQIPPPPKYAHETLHYLIKVCAILPKFEAGRPKWNRVVNLNVEKPVIFL